MAKKREEPEITPEIIEKVVSNLYRVSALARSDSNPAGTPPTTIYTAIGTGKLHCYTTRCGAKMLLWDEADEWEATRQGKGGRPRKEDSTAKAKPEKKRQRTKV